MTDRLWEKPYLTLQEVGELLGLSIRTVRRHVATGRIPVVRLGRAVRVARVDLDTALRRSTAPTRTRRRRRP